MKKIVLLLVCFLMILAYNAIAEETLSPITPEGYQYKLLEDGSAQIVYYAGSGVSQIDIPRELDGHVVTSIAGFDFDDSIIEVNIPDSVIYIEAYAFWNCNSLTKVSIPESVISIGEEAFFGCNSLTEISIPDSVTSIGRSAFASCTSLSEIILPNSVTSIESLFFYCTSLKEVNIPNSVTSIGDRAFYECSSLTNIIIPDSVTSIGDESFYNCVSLTEISIPCNVTSIGDMAFMGCSSLSNVIIPDSVTFIADDAFINNYWDGETPLENHSNYKESLTLTVDQGSYAEQYARENNIEYQYIQAAILSSNVSTECDHMSGNTYVYTTDDMQWEFCLDCGATLTEGKH